MPPSPENHWQTWYTTFDDTHSAEARRHWYSNAAQAYQWARPRYPQALVESVITQAHLTPGSTLLEIGAGPGIATPSFAAKGLTITAVEPSPAACDLARQACAAYPAVTLCASTFEDYPLNDQTFDAVLAPTSFHWIAPEVACKKSAAALKPDGHLILLWATPPQPSETICQQLQPIYDRLHLTDLGKEQHHTETYYHNNFEYLASIVNDSGYFAPSTVSIQAHQSHYSIEKYIALLSTLSPYIALEEEIRKQLFAELAARLTQIIETESLKTTHWFAAQVAPR